MNMNMVSSNSIDKTTQKKSTCELFSISNSAEHIARLDRQMPKPILNNYEGNLFYFVKLVTLPKTTCIFLGQRLCSIDIQISPYKTFKHYYIMGKAVV